LSILYSLPLAYVCGDAKDGHGILQEKPFEMGQSLKEDFKLDIHKEMDLIERKLAELQAMNVDENATKFAMKDYGMERFTKFLLCCFFFILF
jgi:fatty acyl-CoA reductase